VFRRLRVIIKKNKKSIIYSREPHDPPPSHPHAHSPSSTFPGRNGSVVRDFRHVVVGGEGFGEISRHYVRLDGRRVAGGHVKTASAAVYSDKLGEYLSAEPPVFGEFGHRINLAPLPSHHKVVFTR